VAVTGYGVIGKRVADAITLPLIRSSFVGVLALMLPALASAQRQPTPGPTWPSPGAVAIRGAFGSTGAARPAGSTGSAGRKVGHYSCGAGSHQLGYPAASGLAAYPVGGEGAVGSGNSSAPAFSRITKSAGPGGIGIEYLSPNNGFGVPGQGTADIYRFDRASFHRTECDLPSTERVRPRLIQ
jgi:hypothetical protein